MRTNEKLKNILSDVDIASDAREFAVFLTERFNKIQEGEILAAVLLIKMQKEGYTRLDLKKIQETGTPDGEEKKYALLSYPRWLEDLENGSITGRPGEFKPLILEDDRWVYFHKYWVYENFIAKWIHNWANKTHSLAGSAKTDFIKNLNAEQQEAVKVGLERQLLVITGGPGTGKTYIISHLLKGIIKQEKTIRVALSAPTGKAASRLNDSIDAIGTEFKIPVAVTIHSLLGKRRNGTYQYHMDNKLPYDLIVMDEASMIDLSLMYHLLQAIPEKCKVIFLGDKDQLASVEAGSILGDLFQAADSSSSATSNISLADCMVQLTHSYRFGAKSGVGLLAEAFKKQDFDKAMVVLKDKDYGGVRFFEKSFSTSVDEIYERFVRPNFEKIKNTGDVNKALAIFNSSKILLPLRSGPQGLEWVNSHFETRIKNDFGISGLREWFHGRPVTVTKNNYALKIRNGESGICWTNNNVTKLFFETETGKGKAKTVAPGQLSHYETGYTMSIHKSQGSEYDNVIILLPEADFPILTRELLYTAVTRARQNVLVYGRQAILKACVGKRIQRSSGLMQKLQTLTAKNHNIDSDSD